MNSIDQLARDNTHGRIQWRYALEGLVVASLLMGLLTFTRSDVAESFMAAYRGELALLISILLATFLLRLNGESWKNTGLSRPENIRRLPAQTITVMVMAYAVAIFVTFLVAQLLGMEGPSQEQHSGVTGNISEYLIHLTVITWGTAAFLEEMIFRGFLIHRFAAALGNTRVAVVVAVLIQSVLFGLAHPGQGPGGMLMTGAIGLVFGTLYVRYNRNLWPLILAHGIMDTIGFTAIFFGATL